MKYGKILIKWLETRILTQSDICCLFRGLVGSKSLTREDMQVVLDKMKDLLIGKNVASDIAGKLCESVAVKLEGKVRV